MPPRIEPSADLRKGWVAGRATDVRIESVALYFLPIEMRVPLRFGAQTVRHITCARVRVSVRDATGRRAEGWGETPIAVVWVWPSDLPFAARHDALKQLCVELAKAWHGFDSWGHAMELGCAFQQTRLPDLLQRFNATRRDGAVPYLAALLCCSAFDIALHDAYGNLHQRDIYETYTAQFMTQDLASFFSTGEHDGARFSGQFPGDFLRTDPPARLPAWHLVGGLDPLEPVDLTGAEPDDGYPVLLTDWIERDGLDCLKVKLKGNNAPWDYERLVRVGLIGLDSGVRWLSADFNCTVTDPAYVNGILDQLQTEQSRVHEMLLYVEQPFPYDLMKYRIDVRSVAARKPLFLDESAHDWSYVALGRELGWSGVALKTCKTQSGALLSLCWAKQHGMPVMVQDLTNPMLAQIPHVRLAAHAGTIMGVETNAMQYYPEASAAEAVVHPGLYRRHRGQVDLSTLAGSGFGYRVGEIGRRLPKPVVERTR